MTPKTQTHTPTFQTWGELREWTEEGNTLTMQMRKTAVVRAVNAYKHLCDSRKELIDMCKLALDHLNPSPHHSVIEADAYQAIKQAIAKAEGKGE